MIQNRETALSARLVQDRGHRSLNQVEEESAVIQRPKGALPPPALRSDKAKVRHNGRLPRYLQDLLIGGRTLSRVPFVTPVSVGNDVPNRDEDGLLPTVLFQRVFIRLCRSLYNDQSSVERPASLRKKPETNQSQLWSEWRRGASRKDLRFAQIPHNA